MLTPSVGNNGLGGWVGTHVKFEGGFKLTFNDDAGDTITLVPLGYIKA
jgi:hypothetical protein